MLILLIFWKLFSQTDYEISCYTACVKLCLQGMTPFFALYSADWFCKYV